MPKCILIVSEHPIESVDDLPWLEIFRHGTQSNMYTVIPNQRDTAQDEILSLDEVVRYLNKHYIDAPGLVVVTNRISSAAVRHMIGQYTT